MEEDKYDLRVYLAAERTLLAWLRTGLALMAFGFVVARFGVQFQAPALTSSPSSSVWLGSGLILVGVAANVFAATDYARFITRLQRGDIVTSKRSWGAVALALLLGAGGAVASAYLLVFG